MKSVVAGSVHGMARVANAFAAKNKWKYEPPLDFN
jgi:hypothetical protein